MQHRSTYEREKPLSELARFGLVVLSVASFLAVSFVTPVVMIFFILLSSSHERWSWRLIPIAALPLLLFMLTVAAGWGAFKSRATETVIVLMLLAVDLVLGGLPQVQLSIRRDHWELYVSFSPIPAIADADDNAVASTKRCNP